MAGIRNDRKAAGWPKTSTQYQQNQTVVQYGKDKTINL